MRPIDIRATVRSGVIQPDMRATVADKLHPNRVRTGPLLTAFLGLMLDETWTSPRMRTQGITSDGWILPDEAGLAGNPIAHVDQLVRNLQGIAEVAELTPDETAWLLGLIPTAFGQDWRRKES